MPGLPYLRAGDNVLYGAAVNTIAGATEATYEDDWLCDGRNRPARATNGTVTWQGTAPDPAEVDVVIVHSHTIDAGRTVNVTGDVSGSGVGLTARTNGIPVDLWIPVAAGGSPAVAEDIAVGISGNSVAVVIAEVMAGLIRTLEHDFSIDNATIGYLDIATVRRQSKGGSVPNFSRGLVARYIQGDIIVDDVERDVIMDWYESTFEDVRPSAIKPFDDRNEAWLVSFGAQPTFRRRDNLWTASLLFHELPRKRWIAA